MAQRNLRIEDELKRQIETVSRSRGYRSSSAFMIEAIEEKLGRIEAAESMSEAERRLTTDLSRVTRHVNGIHNSVQALYALTDTLTKYIATCIVEPPPDLMVSARARGKLRYEKLIRAAAKTITGESSSSMNEMMSRDRDS
jgi:hypothetical protein